MAIKINQNNITFGSYTLEETPTGLLFDGNISAFFPPAAPTGGGAPTPSPSPPPPPGGPTYSVVAAAGNVNEGSSLTFNVTTTEVADSTTLYWTVTNAGDFTTSSGSFTITSNAGSFSVTPTADSITEGAETFTASVRTGSTSGTIVATSGSVTINDTSTGPTYSVSPAANNVNEGSSLTFNVTTTNVTNGTTLYWTVSRPEDFATSSGSFTINSNAGSFSVTPTADSTTEGAETFTASVRTGSTSGTIVATSSSVTINDTSLSPPPPPPPGVNPPSATLLTFNYTAPNTTIGPINIYYRRLLFKSIYTAAELSAAGWSGSDTIYRISFYVTNVPFYQPIPGWTIGMINTASTVGSDITSGWTTVRNAANASFTVNTENIITLDTPFTWDGTSNLAIGFASAMISPTWNPSGAVRGNTPGNSRSNRTDSSGTYLLTDIAPTTTTYRPVITLYNSL